MQKKIAEFEQEKLEFKESLAKKDKTIAKKRNTTQNLKKKLEEYHIENTKFRQMIDLYQNKNTEGLKKLSVETLSKLEISLIDLLDSIKVQKSIKVLEKQAQKMDEEDIDNCRLFSKMLEKIAK